jgi:hypothetical protein
MLDVSKENLKKRHIFNSSWIWMGNRYPKAEVLLALKIAESPAASSHPLAVQETVFRKVLDVESQLSIIIEPILPVSGIFFQAYACDDHVGEISFITDGAPLILSTGQHCSKLISAGTTRNQQVPLRLVTVHSLPWRREGVRLRRAVGNDGVETLKPDPASASSRQEALDWEHGNWD